MGRSRSFSAKKHPVDVLQKSDVVIQIDGLDYKKGVHGFAYVFRAGRWVRSHNPYAIRVVGAKPDVERVVPDNVYDSHLGIFSSVFNQR